VAEFSNLYSCVSVFNSLYRDPDLDLDPVFSMNGDSDPNLDLGFKIGIFCQQINDKAVV
jgi:hypothetical protein